MPLPARTLSLLHKIKGDAPQPSLGCSRESGAANAGLCHLMAPCRSKAYERVMQRVVRQLGPGGGAAIHTLRHSYATHLIEARWGPGLIQQYLGHSSLQTTGSCTSISTTVSQEQAITVINKLMEL